MHNVDNPNELNTRVGFRFFFLHLMFGIIYVCGIWKSTATMSLNTMITEFILMFSSYCKIFNFIFDIFARDNGRRLAHGSVWVLSTKRIHSRDDIH